MDVQRTGLLVIHFRGQNTVRSVLRSTKGAFTVRFSVMNIVWNLRYTNYCYYYLLLLLPKKT